MINATAPRRCWITLLFLSVSILYWHFDSAISPHSLSAKELAWTVTPLANQWTQTEGPNGGDIKALFTNGNEIFAGTNRGVYLSTENGRSWQAVNNGMIDAVVFALVKSGNTLLAGTDPGLLRSTDNGQTWETISNGLTSRGVTALATNGTAFFAGTPDQGVFRSLDNGQTWQAINNGLTQTNVTSLTATPRAVLRPVLVTVISKPITPPAETGPSGFATLSISIVAGATVKHSPLVPTVALVCEPVRYCEVASGV